MPDQFDDIRKILGEKPGGAKPGSVKSGEPGKVPPATNWINQAIEQAPFPAGVAQGMAGYAEAPAYYAEKGIQQVYPGFRMPLHERAADIRNRVESTTPGIAGEITGTMLPAFIPNPISEMIGDVGMASRLPALARAYEAIGPAGRGMAGGALGGVLASPATTPQEAWTQATIGGVLGGAGGRAAARAGQRVASREGQQAMKQFVMSEEAERGAEAQGTMRYTGGGFDRGGVSDYAPRRDFSNVNRFEPAPSPEPKTPRDVLREQTRIAREAEKADKAKPGSLARRVGTNAAWILAHATMPPGLRSMMGHAGSAAVQSVLDRMSEGEMRSFREYIDVLMSRRGHRPTITGRASAAGGVSGQAAGPLNEPYDFLQPPGASDGQP
jgi:hypothetical protein